MFFSSWCAWRYGVTLCGVLFSVFGEGRSRSKKRNFFSTKAFLGIATLSSGTSIPGGKSKSPRFFLPHRRKKKSGRLFFRGPCRCLALKFSGRLFCGHYRRRSELMKRMNMRPMGRVFFLIPLIMISGISRRGWCESIAVTNAPEVQSRDDAQTQIDEASRLFKAQRLSEALAALAQAVEVNPDSAPAHYLFAQVLSARGQHDEGLRHAEKAVSLNPVNGRYYATLTALY